MMAALLTTVFVLWLVGCSILIPYCVDRHDQDHER